MVGEQRLNAEERRKSILDAAMPLFARKGLHGCTTREIAEAAGVSEALLYRHYPSKEALYQDTHLNCCTITQNEAEKLAKLPVNTSTLVMTVYFLSFAIMVGLEEKEHNKNVKRLMAGSLIEDGEFARSFLSSRMLPWMPKFENLIKAAKKNGDLILRKGEKTPDLIWFCHNLPVMLGLTHLPDKAVISYESSLEDLVGEVTLFCLRGLGLTAEAIDTHYNPQTYALMMNSMKDKITNGSKK